MDAKLTLNLDRETIEQAKEYAKMHHISLSRLIESYLSSLVIKKHDEFEITPLVKSLSGAIELTDDSEMKKEYTSFLIDKYK